MCSHAQIFSVTAADNMAVEAVPAAIQGQHNNSVGGYNQNFMTASGEVMGMNHQV